MADKKTLSPEEKKLAAEKHVDELVQKALVALEEMRKLNQEQVDYIVAKASVAALDAHGELALHAYEETGRGVFEDKATKNLFACEHVVNNMRHTKTVGVISEDDVTGLTLIAEPVGVVCGITPTTNPTSTAIFKALISLKTRNPIVFAFHPSAQESSAHAAQIVRDAAIKAGAPENCVQWITQPSMEATSALMNHDGVATILATGGNAMVKAAYSCGKPALGVGAGNVPAYVEKSANIRQAAHDIVMSKSFDNGMVCASEQAVIIDKEIYDEFVEEFKSYHTYFVNKKEKALLEEFCFGVKANSKNFPVVSLSFNTAFSISTVMMPLAVRSELYLSLTSARKPANRPLSLAFRTSPFLAFHSCGVQDMPVEMAALLPSTVMRQSMLAVPSAFTFCLLM